MILHRNKYCIVTLFAGDLLIDFGVYSKQSDGWPLTTLQQFYFTDEIRKYLSCIPTENTSTYICIMLYKADTEKLNKILEDELDIDIIF